MRCAGGSAAFTDVAAVAAALEPDVDAAPAALRDLFVELGHLKRIRSAGRDGSIATRLFARAWDRLAAGDDPEAVGVEIAAAAVAAARLGDIDGEILAAAGLDAPAGSEVLREAIRAVAGEVDSDLRQRLLAVVGRRTPVRGSVPRFVAQLADQPRAGITCPGRARIVLEPPENHAEHCLIVGVYGVLLAPVYRADIGHVFLMALSHHLHNAALPDSGFTGEMLLGCRLSAVMHAFAEEALAELSAPVRAAVERVRTLLVDADTAEGRAFHAADVLDRVLQIESHLAAASLKMESALGDMELVHDGPVKAFHERVLTEMGLP